MKITFFLFLMAVSIQNMAAQKDSDDALTFDFAPFAVSVLSETQRRSTTDRLVSATPEMIAKYAPDGTVPSAVNAFLIETVESTILVDAGYGRKLFARLQTCGKKPEDIDAILLTHMHGDHIGGLLIEGRKSFPDATLYISKPEHDFWMSDREMNSRPDRRNNFIQAREVIAAYKDKLSIFVPGDITAPCKEILPGIQGVAAYGHTPGHAGFLLSSDEDQLLIWGDLTHAMAIQMPCPQVAMTFDTDPATAIAYRQQILKYVAGNKIRIAGMHIEYPGMGNVRKNKSDGYDFTLLCTCEGRFR